MRAFSWTGGYLLESVTPVDQFRHSPHVELVAVFRRPKPTAAARAACWGEATPRPAMMNALSRPRTRDNPMPDDLSTDSFLSRLAAIVGAKNVLTDLNDTALYLAEPRELFSRQGALRGSPGFAEESQPSQTVRADKHVRRAAGRQYGLVGGQIPGRRGGRMRCCSRSSAWTVSVRSIPRR